MLQSNRNCLKAEKEFSCAANERKLDDERAESLASGKPDKTMNER